jgi:hypothetical protein
MVALLFSKITILYLILAIFCEYLTRYGYFQLNATGSKKILHIAKLFSYFVISINIYYSAITAWYLFPALFAVQIILFVVLDAFLKKFIRIPSLFGEKMAANSYYPSM